MALFALLSPNENPALAQALELTFPGDHLKTGIGQWMVAARGTAKELSDGLGISDGRVGTVIVITVGAYWGRGSNDVWEWMSTRLQRVP
jgi:hypothetical protein